MTVAFIAERDFCSIIIITMTKAQTFCANDVVSVQMFIVGPFC